MVPVFMAVSSSRFMFMFPLYMNIELNALDVRPFLARGVKMEPGELEFFQLAFQQVKVQA